jgi:outer membrane immunogenic protein
MRRYSLIALAAGAIGLVASVASAADLPRKAPAYQPPPPPPPFNWTGFYVGGFFGAGWVRNDVDASINTFFFDGDPLASFTGPGSNSTGVGPLGGVTVGWNWQMPNSPIVLGIEGDFAWADLKGSSDRQGSFDQIFCCYVLNSTTASLRTQFTVRDIATITGRFGLISGPQDRYMWYVKGGGAWAKANVNSVANARNVIFCCDEESLHGSLNDNFNKWGWTVGTGLEFALWDRWSAKVEYDFMSFGTRNFNSHSDTGGECDVLCSADFSASLKEQIHVVKVGLNYRWGGFGKAPY